MKTNIKDLNKVQDKAERINRIKREGQNRKQIG